LDGIGGSHGRKSFHLPSLPGVFSPRSLCGSRLVRVRRGRKILWRTTLDGAPGGGIITYAVDGEQRVAFAVGTNSPICPVEKKTAKIVVFGR